MVLAELGGKLRESLRKLHTSSSVTQTELSTLLNEIARALMEADVNVKLVMTMRDRIKTRVEDLLQQDEEGKQQLASTTATTTTSSQNLSKTVQRAVVDELVDLLSPGDAKKQNKAYVMRRGKPNVILFVGLQGAGKTTTIAKFANYYQRRGWKTSM